MSGRLKVACVQLNARDDKAANIEKAAALVARAAASGAELVVLPEKWDAIGPAEVIRANAESLADGESVTAMRSWAREHRITLVGGSITERRDDSEKLSNSCVVFDSEGEVVALYRKIHMFDAEVGGQVYRESEAQAGGDEAVVCEAAGWQLGLTVCYDLRFPELYRILALAGAELIAIPAAFTLFTGKDHWEVLVRARAIENQCFVLAANQWGTHPPSKPSFGRSLIVDPWGVVLAQAGDEDTVIVAELERSRLELIRRNLPSLANRRPAAYRWPATA